jgi:hypothetical protein
MRQKTVTPSDEVQKYLYKPLPLSRDMKQKNVISLVAWFIVFSSLVYS